MHRRMWTAATVAGLAAGSVAVAAPAAHASLDTFTTICEAWGGDASWSNYEYFSCQPPQTPVDGETDNVGVAGRAAEALIVQAPSEWTCDPTVLGSRTQTGRAALASLECHPEEE